MSALLQSKVVSVAESCGRSYIVLVCFDGTPGGEVWLQLHLRPAHFVAGESDNHQLGEPIAKSDHCAGNDAECQQMTFVSWLYGEARARLDLHESRNLSSVVKAIHRTLESVRRAQIS